MGTLECSICQNNYTEEFLVLLPCLHVVCFNCKEDLLNDGEKQMNCYFGHCNFSFKPKETQFFNPILKKQRVSESAANETVDNAKECIDSYLDDSETQLTALENFVERKLILHEDAFEFLKAADTIIEKKILYYQKLQEAVHNKVFAHIGASFKSSDDMKDKIKGLKERIIPLNEVSDSISVQIHPPMELIEHTERQAERIQKETYNLDKEVEAFLVLKTKFVQYDQFELRVSTVKEVFDLQLEALIAKHSLSKKDLFGDEWETAEWQWINPLGIVFFNYKNDSICLVKHELLGTSQFHEIIQSWNTENSIEMNYIESQYVGLICLVNKQGREFFTKYKGVYDTQVINNFPFGFLKLSDFSYIQLENKHFARICYNQEQIIYFENDDDEDLFAEGQPVPFVNLLFFTTPNLPRVLIYDKTTQMAYPFNQSYEPSVINLKRYGEDVVGVFTSFCTKYLFVFLASDPHYARVLKKDSNEELYRFTRPTEIQNYKIISVVLISNTSFLLETKESIFIF